jgi:hypothetical protein
MRSSRTVRIEFSGFSLDRLSGAALAFFVHAGIVSGVAWGREADRDFKINSTERLRRRRKAIAAYSSPTAMTGATQLFHPTHIDARDATQPGAAASSAYRSMNVLSFDDMMHVIGQ